MSETNVVITDYTKYTIYPSTHEQLGVMKKVLGKDLTDSEFFLFCDICTSLNLNPIIGEVFPIKIDGSMKPCVGRDGLRTNAERHKDFISVQAKAIYEKDIYKANYVTGEVTHINESGLKDRGDLLGAWCKVTRKGFPVIYEDVLITDYKKDTPAWKSRPEKMIVKCAEANALKRAFPIAGVVIDEDIKYKKEKDNSFITDAELDQTPTEYDEKLQRLFDLVTSSKSKDKSYYKKLIVAEQEKGKLTLESIEKWIETFELEETTKA